MKSKMKVQTLSITDLSQSAMIRTYTKQVADTHSTVAKIICNLTMQYNTTVIFDAKCVQKMPQRIIKGTNIQI